MRMYLLLLVGLTSLMTAAESTGYVPGIGTVAVRTDVVVEPTAAGVRRQRALAAGESWQEAFPAGDQARLAVIHPLVRAKGDAHAQRGAPLLLGSTITVSPKPGVSAAALAKAHGMTVAQVAAGTDSIRFRARDPVTALAVIADLHAGGDVVSVEAEVHWPMELRASFGDPLEASQWHLPLIGAAEAWDEVTGAGVVIAVVDSGFDLAHEDLAANMRLDLGLDPIGGDTDPAMEPPFDDVDEFHGTWVAGMAAAVGGNALGGVGAAPEADIAPVRLITGHGVTPAQETAAMQHGIGGVDPADRVSVSNNSWGPVPGSYIPVPSAGMRAALADGAVNGRGGLGIIYVWAAGNSAAIGDDSAYDGYASNRHVLTVGASTSTGAQASYSENGCNVLLHAPGGGSGVGVVTSDPTGSGADQGITGADRYTASGNHLFGTSFAAPIVAGVAALLCEADPSLTRRDLIHVLVHTATSAGSSQAAVGVSRPFHHGLGFGRIHAGNAVTAVSNGSWRRAPAEAASIAASRTTRVSIPDDNPTGISQSVTLNASTRFRCEWVELTVDIRHTYRGDLSLVLTSPGGRQTRIAPRGGLDSGENLIHTFCSVAHWREAAAGSWTLTVADNEGLDTGTLRSWSIRAYGYLAPSTPALTSISPNVIPIGSGDTVLTITGSGFDADARLVWGGMELATTFISPSLLEATIPAAMLVAPYANQANVHIPPFVGDGGGTTGVLPVHAKALPTVIPAEATATFGEDAIHMIDLTVSDPDGNPNDVIVTATSSDDALLPASALVLGGSGADRTLTIMPLRDRNGDCVVTVTVFDGWLSASADIAVTVTPVDDPPQVDDLMVRVDRSPAAVLAAFSGSDAEGHSLTYAKLSDPDAGSVVVAADGSFTWTPPLEIFTGVTTFTVEATANAFDSEPATAFIVVRDPALLVPWIVSEPAEEVAPGEAWTWTIRIDRATIGALGDLTFTLIQGPDGMSFPAAQSSVVVAAPEAEAVLSWTADGADRHVPVVIEVRGDHAFNQGFDAARVLLRVRSVVAVE